MYVDARSSYTPLGRDAKDWLHTVPVLRSRWSPLRSQISHIAGCTGNRGILLPSIKYQFSMWMPGVFVHDQDLAQETHPLSGLGLKLLVDHGCFESYHHQSCIQLPYATLDATRRHDDQAEPFNLSYVWNFRSVLSTTSRNFRVSALRQSPYQHPPQTSHPQRRRFALMMSRSRGTNEKPTVPLCRVDSMAKRRLGTSRTPKGLQHSARNPRFA